MTYFTDVPLGRPFQIYADLSAWRKRFDVDKRVVIAGIWKGDNGILDPKEMPDVLPLESKVKSIPEVFVSDGGMVICSGKVKKILDEFDPNVHQFIPIKVRFANGVTSTEKHYILNVHYACDTLIDGKSKVLLGKDLQHEIALRINAYLNNRASEPGDLAVDAAKCGLAHIWRERAFPGIYMMTDELFLRFKKEGIRFFKPIRAVDC